MTSYVYTIRDSAQRILYIGVTDNPERRLRQHRRNWAHRYGAITADLDSFEDRTEAERAEARAISRYSPPHNRMHLAPIVDFPRPLRPVTTHQRKSIAHDLLRARIRVTPEQLDAICESWSYGWDFFGEFEQITGRSAYVGGAA